LILLGISVRGELAEPHIGLFASASPVKDIFPLKQDVWGQEKTRG
jgi:hypothetical protein